MLIIHTLKGSYSTINKFRRLLEPSKVYFDTSIDTCDTDLIDSLKSEVVGLRQEISLLREEIRTYLDTVSDTVDAFKSDTAIDTLKIDTDDTIDALYDTIDSTVNTLIDTSISDTISTFDTLVKSRCLELRKQGLSYSQISKTLTQYGLLNARGKPFTSITLQRWIIKSK